MADRRDIRWTEYMKYRARLRGFDLNQLEDVIKHSLEHYRDLVTDRFVVIGRHGKTLVMIPYEITEGYLTPITVHATTRQQINFRLRTGRFVHEHQENA